MCMCICVSRAHISNRNPRLCRAPDPIIRPISHSMSARPKMFVNPEVMKCGALCCGFSCGAREVDFLRSLLGSGVCEIKYHFKTTGLCLPTPPPYQSKLNPKCEKLICARTVLYFTRVRTWQNIHSTLTCLGGGVGKCRGPFLKWYFISQTPEPKSDLKNEPRAPHVKSRSARQSTTKNTGRSVTSGGSCPRIIFWGRST